MDRWRRYGRLPVADVYGLLADIRSRPDEWTDLGSLRELNLLLNGYRAAAEIHDVGEALDFPFGNPGPFAVWVDLWHPNRYVGPHGSAVRQGSHWADWPTTIERVADERGVPAFDLFFELLDGFLVARAGYRFGREAARVPDVPTVVDVPFSTIASRSALPWFEQGESDYRAKDLVAVLHAQPEWHRVWALEHGDDAATRVTSIDFASSMVVVVEIGARPSGAYGVEVERLVQADGVLYVCAVEIRPGPGVAGGAVTTHPSASVVTRRFDGPIRLVRRIRTSSVDDIGKRRGSAR